MIEKLFIIILKYILKSIIYIYNKKKVNKSFIVM